MKKQALTTIAITLFLASSLFINPSNAVTQTNYTLQSNGTIIQNPTQNETLELTVILRSICITDLNPNRVDINAWVDQYVANHPYVTAVTLSDMHQYGIWWYGYSFSNTSGTWMGWNYTQLKTLIDRLHYNDWKVGIETTGIAWDNQQEYNYIKHQHPELAFVNKNGVSAAVANIGKDKLVPDFFAKFSTPDTVNNITVGTRLIDLYTTRLTQMIKEGLEWDFWFGTDGWNGFNLQGYFWGSFDPSMINSAQYYSFSYQEEAEFGNFTEVILPENWATMNNIQRATAITENSKLSNAWWHYWQVRFAQMYAQIRQAFIDSGSNNEFYTIGTCDRSSEPAGTGYLGPVGMYNITLLTQYNAIDYFYNDQESTSATGAINALGREQAYGAALTRMQTLSAKPIIGLEIVDCLGYTYPLWAVKQEYLSQAINYVWYNGQRYRVSDPSVVMLQYPTAEGWSGWSKADAASLFSFIETTNSLLRNADPLWLGPVYPIPDKKSGALGMAWWGMNFSFAQWASAKNLASNPQYINEDMGAFILDQALADGGPALTGLYDRMVNQLWTSGELNLWYYEPRGMDWGISKVWDGYEQESQSAFHIQYNPGATLTYSIPKEITDPNAKWIAEGYEGTTYYVDGDPVFHGMYVAQTGFVTIASFTNDQPNRIAAGYYSNDASGTFLLTHMPSGYQSRYEVLPRNMLNKMLYWISNCPVSSSEPLMDLKILTIGEKILISITDQKNVGNSFSIPQTITSTLNIQKLQLDSPDTYNIYWASNQASAINVDDWNNLDITLNGGADILVIEPK